MTQIRFEIFTKYGQIHKQGSRLSSRYNIFIQSMYEDHSFGGDYNNQYGYIGDPFAQNNEADENYIY